MLGIRRTGDEWASPSHSQAGSSNDEYDAPPSGLVPAVTRFSSTAEVAGPQEVDMARWMMGSTEGSPAGGPGLRSRAEAAPENSAEDTEDTRRMKAVKLARSLIRDTPTGLAKGHLGRFWKLQWDELQLILQPLRSRRQAKEVGALEELRAQFEMLLETTEKTVSTLRKKLSAQLGPQDALLKLPATGDEAVARYSVAETLIMMGDLQRYRAKYVHAGSHSSPEYRACRKTFAMAVKVHPQVGWAWNQLAVIETDKLRQVFFYYRAVSVAKPYPSLDQLRLQLGDAATEWRKTSAKDTVADGFYGRFFYIHHAIASKTALDRAESTILQASICCRAVLDGLGEEESVEWLDRIVAVNFCALVFCSQPEPDVEEWKTQCARKCTVPPRLVSGELELDISAVLASQRGRVLWRFLTGVLEEIIFAVRRKVPAAGQLLATVNWASVWLVSHQPVWKSPELARIRGALRGLKADGLVCFRPAAAETAQWQLPEDKFLIGATPRPLVFPEATETSQASQALLSLVGAGEDASDSDEEVVIYQGLRQPAPEGVDDKCPDGLEHSVRLARLGLICDSIADMVAEPLSLLAPQPKAPLKTCDWKPLIVVDAPNVALKMGGFEKKFCSRGVQIVLEHYLSLGHEVVAFLPEYYVDAEAVDKARIESRRRGPKGHEVRVPDDIQLLWDLVKKKILVVTPPQDYDDSYAIAHARRNEGCIVTNDLYRDYLEKQKGEQNYKEAKSWVKTHSISFTFVGDVFLPNPDFRFPPPKAPA
mmetsp:Transcript_84613/g.226140  ORF Transcript_84613/g.226140 Transcript_84613/m.226140 type:complete len:764 (-) Transcript_84613:171-2462(-)